MSGRRVSEFLAAVGVIGSLLFVGQELKQSNLQARAAAYQEIGIATADFHLDLSDTLVRLLVEAEYPEGIARWSTLDWERFFRYNLAGMRLAETVLLQVDQGLLTSADVDRLGYHFLRTGFLGVPANACIWPRLSAEGAISQDVREYVEETPEALRYQCPLDLEALRDEWIDAEGAS